MKYIDLTHTFVVDMPVYPGDLVPELVQIADLHKEGYTDHQIKTSMHVGTHMDSPLHMLEGGKRLSDIAVEKFFGRGCLIDARGASIVGVDFLSKSSVKQNDIVLVMTGFSKRYGQREYYGQYPEIDEDFARKAIELGVKIVGMDTPSPDRPPFKVHKLLLQQEILIIENLTNLDLLIGFSHFEIFALPAKLHTEAASVRVIAKIEEDKKL